MRAFAMFAAAAVLAGCVQVPGRRDRLDQLVGQPETLVVRTMGVPERTIETDGHRFLAYVERQPASFAGYDMFDGFGRYGTLGYRRLGFEAAPELYERSCETTFEVVGGKVAGYTLHGDGCG